MALNEIPKATDWSDASRMPNDPLVHDGLFNLTKDYYKADDLFTATDRLDISEETFQHIVKQLERFDLSKTGDDIKGLAFEKFLGAIFRGEPDSTGDPGEFVLQPGIDSKTCHHRSEAFVETLRCCFAEEQSATNVDIQYIHREISSP